MAANRTSGVAPVCIHCFSDWVAASDSSNRFRNYLFVWNFDDSGTWSTTGKSKNVEYGAAAAHVYESAGVYTITLTVYEFSGGVKVAIPAAAESIEVTISDPDTVYATTKTTCVNPSGDSDFTGKPTGAGEVSTDDLTTIEQYADAGERVLFKRGASWTSSGIDWPDNAGPVTIGAYGTGADPQITMTGDYFLHLGFKQDWRVMNISLIDSSETYYAMYGLQNVQKLLILGMTVSGFYQPVQISHYNPASGFLMKEDIAVVDCDFSDMKSWGIYAGSERLAILGNVLANSDSHVIRIWQSYRGVISHNRISGADLNAGIGHNLKFHGQDDSLVTLTPSGSTSEVKYHTQFSVISDNTFGTAVWPVIIGPTNTGVDDRLKDIIFERNRVIAEYGSGPYLITNTLVLESADLTVRNNIFDATGGGGSTIGVLVRTFGVAPVPDGVEIYNNTVYRSDNASGNRTGFSLASGVLNTIIRNNLVSFAGSDVDVAILDNSTNLTESNNLLTDAPELVDPDNATPLNRDFNLVSSSPAINYGTDVNVYDDYDEDVRVWGGFVAGAHELDTMLFAQSIALKFG